MDKDKLLIWVLIGVIIVGVVWFVWQQRTEMVSQQEGDGFAPAGAFPEGPVFARLPCPPFDRYASPVDLPKNEPPMEAVDCSVFTSQDRCKRGGCWWSAATMCGARGSLSCLSLHRDACLAKEGCAFDDANQQCYIVCPDLDNSLTCEENRACKWIEANKCYPFDKP